MNGNENVMGGTLGRYTNGPTRGISHGGKFAVTLGRGTSVLGNGYNGSATLGRRPVAVSNNGIYATFRPPAPISNGNGVANGRQQAVVAPICRETDL